MLGFRKIAILQLFALFFHNGLGVPLRRPPIALHLDDPILLRNSLRHQSTSIRRPIELTIDLVHSFADDWTNLLDPSVKLPMIKKIEFVATTHHLQEIGVILSQLVKNVTIEVSVKLNIPDFLTDLLEFDLNPLWDSISRVNSVTFYFLSEACTPKSTIKLPLNLPINSVPFPKFISKCKLSLTSPFPPCREYEFEKVDDGVGVYMLNLCRCSGTGCH